MTMKSRHRVYGLVVAGVILTVAVLLLVIKSKHEVEHLSTPASTRNLDVNFNFHRISDIATKNSIVLNQQLTDILYRESHFQQLLNIHDVYANYLKPYDTRQSIEDIGNPLSLVMPSRTKNRRMPKVDFWDFINSDRDKQVTVPPQTGNKDGSANIVIVTNRRSGSSFLGQIFNQNPDFFFHFEPLKLLESLLGYRELQSNVSEFLGNIFKCNFEQIPDLADFYNKEGLHRASSNLLISEQFCQQPNVSRRTVNKCNKIDTQTLTNMCRTVQNIAVKVIRVVDITSLQTLLEDNTLNVKVIHLVRDPRAIYNSRVNAEKLEMNLDSDQETAMAVLCKRMVNNYQTAQSHPKWLENRYMIVRYEDLAEDPLKIAQQMYEFIGIKELPLTVKSWIVANSNANPVKKDVYSTQRNASSVVQAWRLELPFHIVQRIDNICSPLLTALGYSQALTPTQLTNTTFNMFRPLPIT